jgi:pimeloyl-ACP methyl ester carboxylesterase
MPDKNNLLIKISIFVSLFLSIQLFASSSAIAADKKILSEDFFIDSSVSGIKLFMRHKHLPGVKDTTGNKTLLYVHGATYPSETAFDLPIEGVSMMDLFVKEGFDVYLVDIRGYGGSTRPKEMSEPAADNKPIVHTQDAVDDFGSAVDYILKKNKVSKINIMGWSWGTSITGMYTTQHNDKVNRLVLYAPLWLYKADTAMPAPPSSAKADAPNGIGAYRLVSRESAKDRWLKGVAADQKDKLIPPGVYEAWTNSTWATDPQAAQSGSLRAPNGVLDDIKNFWMAGKPMYDPNNIRVPTLLMHAEWDADLPSYQAQAYFSEMKSAPYKRLIELSEGTHTVMLEKNRMQFFREIHLFLTEKNPLAIK